MQGVGGAPAEGGIGGAPYKKMFFCFFYSVQGVGGALAGGYRGLAPYKKKWGKKKILYARSYEGGGISPPQELEVGARRAPYLLVNDILHCTH